MARNGHLEEDGIVLVAVEDNDRLIATAAASFVAMRAAAAKDGVTISIVEPAGAYRSAWVQNDMVDHPERYNLNPASSIGFSRSGQSHGWGNRFDANSAAVPWLLRRGAAFGWTREYGARDPNHFKHDGVTAIAGGGPSGIITHPTPGSVEPEREEDEDMKPMLLHIVNANGSQQWAYLPGDLSKFVPVWTVEAANDISRVYLGGEGAVDVIREEWNAFRAAAGLPEDLTVGSAPAAT